ncbi:oxaloacetate decarboxylase gamma subunit [Desulfobotulus alkaliphilus]|uniref:Oxaloacetate decarboxylase gamma subunit n=1 Tax=Desulfobotulus alkaliphilus TaxID=622671 RepID=A0A562S0P7_9BACT|nr:OadG family transporter subunit [Desulfobotulus alkaliphilus]TWI74186.1 oxaloacetate decarboxylase gamma subunit [Desulfobotulus alkaliphilus]
MPEYGLDAIASHNGWEMAFLGILIVFTCLSLLAFSISRLHRILAFFDARKDRKSVKKGGPVTEGASVSDRPETPALKGFAGFQEACGSYALLAEKMGSPLSLPGLLEQAEKRGIARSHAILADLVRTGVLKPDGRGFYVWEKAAFEGLFEGGESQVKKGSRALPA